MINDYITKIKANINIYTTRKTSNILDGTYQSVYKGRSMNFEDLREYVIGDNIKDIDWKASARSGNLLIRQYIAEKKHNIMLVLDTGKKMLGDTEGEDSKKEVALMTAGTIAYLADKNGDYVSSVYNKSDSVNFFPFKSGIFNIQRILSSYEHDAGEENKEHITKSLEYITNYIRRRMIIFIVTDLEGMESIDEEIIRKLTTFHDVMFINVSDACMTGNKAYDVDSSLYIPSIVLKNKKLNELEKNLKQEIFDKCVKKFEKYRISIITVDSNKEIAKKVIELLERHRYANIR